MRAARLRCRLAAVITAAVLAAALVPTGAQTVDLFDDQQVYDLQLFIHSRDLQRLRAEYELNTYYPADLEWGGTRLRNVAVRNRGAGSRNPTKLGLRVDFDHYTTGQELGGVKALVLDNLWQDPSMMRERLAMAFFSRMGQPAPRETFCRLHINRVYQGLYACVEEIDDRYLARTFNDATGYLYEFHWLFPFYGQDLGSDPAAYEPLFEARTHDHESQTALYEPLADLFRAVNEPDEALWRDEVERHLDLAQVVTHAAIQNFLAENDGLLGYAGMNNFYLYRGAQSSVHRVLTWDEDNAFAESATALFLRASENVIVGRALARPDLRELYLQVLEAAADAATADNWLAGTIERHLGLIDESVRADRLKRFSDEEFDAAVAGLRQFAQTHAAWVRNEIARLRSAAAADVRQ
jgi:spore coat protein CotH